MLANLEQNDNIVSYSARLYTLMSFVLVYPILVGRPYAVNGKQLRVTLLFISSILPNITNLGSGYGN